LKTPQNHGPPKLSDKSQGLVPSRLTTREKREINGLELQVKMSEVGSQKKRWLLEDALRARYPGIWVAKEA